MTTSLTPRPAMLAPQPAGRWRPAAAALLLPLAASLSAQAQPAQGLGRAFNHIAPIQAAPAQPASTPTGPWQGLWQGQVGTQHVVLALYPDAQRGGWAGRYFYQRFGRDLTLWSLPVATQATAQPALQLQECPPDYGSSDSPCQAPSGQWTLSPPTRSKAGGWHLSGQLQATGQPGRRPPSPSPVSLTRVADYDPSGEAFHDRYEKARMAGTQRQVGAGGQMGPVAWQTLRDPRSKVTAPQFTRGASPAVLARINQQIHTRWQERVAESLTAIDHDDELRVAFANPRWLALTHSWGLYQAGAAHPTNGFAATTFDLSTGQPVNWAQVFRFTSPRAETLDINRRDLLAAQALRALTARSADQQGTDDIADASCARRVLDHYGCTSGRCASGDLTQGRVPADWQLWPTAEGLAVSADVYSEADRGCRGEFVVLPWAEARRALLRPRTLP